MTMLTIAHLSTTVFRLPMYGALRWGKSSALAEARHVLVQVTLSDAWHPFFAHFLGADITPIVVDARAELVGESKVCVIALMPQGAGAISMTKNSLLEGNGCSVYSNSKNSQGISLSSGSGIKADLVCSAGGVLNKGAVSGTKVLTDCPPMPDPLASRKPPTFGACDYAGTIVKGKAITLKPGVYCGGIIVMNGGSVTFSPGNYIMNGGPFLVKDTSKIKGKNVAFYLTGLGSLIQFFDSATIDLSGAEDGVMAAADTVVLSYRTWQRKFGGDPNIIGKMLDDNGVQVIGVMPPDFKFPEYAESWIPLARDSGEMQQRRSRYFQTFGRLKAGQSLASAQAEMKTVAARLAHEGGMPVTMDLDTVYKGLDDLLPHVDCLITSQSLAGELSGIYDEREALKRLHERFGCYLVAMTQGARGSLAYVGNQYIATPAFRPPVCKDTTGAGDAFRAGFIYGLARKLPIEETLRCANAVAALSCRELGARAGLPPETELREFIASS